MMSHQIQKKQRLKAIYGNQCQSFIGKHIKRLKHKPIIVTALSEVHIMLSCSTTFSYHLYKPAYAHNKIISYTYTEPSNKFNVYTQNANKTRKRPQICFRIKASVSYPVMKHFKIQQFLHTWYRQVYTGCPRRNRQNFGRVLLMLNYTDITQNTYIQSWTVTEKFETLTTVTHLLISKYILKLAGICGFCNVNICT